MRNQLHLFTQKPKLEIVSREKLHRISVMASLEKFCLRWNDFETNVSQAFRELREEKDFFDVTLACEDEQVSAHKVILSACSPLFRGILRKNPHQHPLLYLKGVKYQEMLAVLNFMYMGEVNVAQDDLNSFLAVAEELRVKGLTQGEGTSSRNSGDREPPEKDRVDLGLFSLGHDQPSVKVRSNSKSLAGDTARLPVKVEPPTELPVSSYSSSSAYGVSESPSYNNRSGHISGSRAKQADRSNTYQPEPIGDTYACEEYAGQDYEEQEGEEEYSLGNGFTGDDAYHASGVDTGASAGERFHSFSLTASVYHF